MAKRWTADIYGYKNEETLFFESVEINEVEELQEIIEGGPDWTETPDIRIDLYYNWRKS